MGLSMWACVRTRARIKITAGPVAGIAAETSQHGLCIGKLSGAGGEGDINAVRGKTDNIGFPITVYVRNHARIKIIASPAAGIAAEISQHRLRGAEVWKTVGEGNREDVGGHRIIKENPITVYVR